MALTVINEPCLSPMLKPAHVLLGYEELQLGLGVVEQLLSTTAAQMGRGDII